MKKIFLLVLTIFLFNCKSKSVEETKRIETVIRQEVTKETSKENFNLEIKWMLIEFADFKKEELIDKKAHLILDGKAASGAMGCNTFSFQYNVKTESITFSKGIATQMYCEDMKLENDFMRSLSTISGYRIDGHFLHLTNEKGTVMKFIAEDWD